MKIGNIKEIVSDFATKFREAKFDDREISESFEYKIKALPKNNLDDFFQKKFNKNLNYDQWAGIRETLEGMGRELYSKALTVIGDSVFLIQAKNQDKIEELEQKIRDADLENTKLKVELKKYID